MGAKPRKKPIEAPKKPSVTRIPPPKAASLLKAMEQELRAQLRIVKSRRAALFSDEFNKELAIASTTLARGAVALSTETRQHEKHLREVVRQFSPREEDAVVREWLEGISRKRQQDFMGHLEELGAKGSLLGH